jgi:hypothetical protein
VDLATPVKFANLTLVKLLLDKYKEVGLKYGLVKNVPLKWLLLRSLNIHKQISKSDCLNTKQVSLELDCPNPKICKVI